MRRYFKILSQSESDCEFLMSEFLDGRLRMGWNRQYPIARSINQIAIAITQTAEATKMVEIATEKSHPTNRSSPQASRCRFG